MADEGMLLNFSIPDTGIIAKPRMRGGTWRDRAAAKKAAEVWHSRASARLKGETFVKKVPQRATDVNLVQLGPRAARSQEVTEDPGSHERPVKRARVNGDFRPSASEKQGASDFRPHTNADVTKKLGDKPEVPKGGKQIISSLFSYNPASTTKPQAQEARKDDAPIEPSNAPLNSDLDTFTSIGISTTLASHLLNKMDLKAPTAIQKAAISQLIKDDSDAFVQAETGSGKTLAYLLPIVQRLMELSANMKKRKEDDQVVQRSSGLFAIILAPTRELSKQIAVVLEKLLGCAHWLVATTVIGGEKKKSEKARLRKGINILVATPGRLADHLEHTEALDVSNVRWLVLDEGDRLMELGFEQEIQRIVGALNLRMRAKKSTESKIPGLPEKRTTVLCSATMKLDVERLGQISLKDAVHIRVDASEAEGTSANSQEGKSFAPAQLKQSYAVVAPKLRLVSLISYLKRAFVRKGSVMKAIVFVSCADSVDFHFGILTNNFDEPSNAATESKADTDGIDKKTHKKKPLAKVDPTKLTVTHAEAPIISPKSHTVTTYRLHGSLQQSLRTSTLAHFTKNKDPAVLIATDVASRGLDLPNVDLVVEFDPAFAREDHLHRIGRTARAGRDGRACIFLMPGCEEGYVDILKSDRKDSDSSSHITRQDADDILNKGLVTSGVVEKHAYMEKATDLQLAVERWALASPQRLEAARRAFQSHVRAYATHVAPERQYFDIKQLHLGHLAKAFALRERPSGMKVPGLRTGAGRNDRTPVKVRGAKASTTVVKPSAAKSAGDLDLPDQKDTEEAAKMRKAVRAREKFMRHAGMADEFNLG